MTETVTSKSLTITSDAGVGLSRSEWLAARAAYLDRMTDADLLAIYRSTVRSHCDLRAAFAAMGQESSSLTAVAEEEDVAYQAVLRRMESR